MSTFGSTARVRDDPILRLRQYDCTFVDEAQETPITKEVIKIIRKRFKPQEHLDNSYFSRLWSELQNKKKTGNRKAQKSIS